MKKIFSFIIADDEEELRKINEEILKSKFPNSSFFQFPDGLKAKKWMAENPGGNLIVITDVEMPNLDGIGLVEFIKGEPKLWNIPIVVISGYLEAKETVEGLGCRFLKKPFKIRELLEIISEFTKEK